MPKSLRLIIQGYMLVYGRNVAEEVIKRNIKINKIYIQDNMDSDITSKLSNYKKITMKKREMDNKFPYVHQGIVMDISDYKYKELKDIRFNNSLVVMLDHIEDPHNFGAIIRTCEAAGVEYIIIPDNRSVEVNSTVIKTSVGTVFNMNIIKVTNLVNTINYLKKNGFWVVGTDMIGTDYTEIDYKGNTCIIVGNEGKGMSRLVSDNCDFIASIPMLGEVNSLNASVACAIVVFEAVKSRR